MFRLFRHLDDREWTARAACAQEEEADLWFPDQGNNNLEYKFQTAVAKHICRVDCAVRSDCLDYALANDERYGIWGGLDPRERAHLLNRQRPLR